MRALADRHLAATEALKSALRPAGYRFGLRPGPVMETSTEFELEVASEPPRWPKSAHMSVLDADK